MSRSPLLKLLPLAAALLCAGAQAELRYRIQDLSVLNPSDPNAYSLATALNDAGMVVGTAGDSGSTSAHAFVFRDGRMQSLGSLNGIPAVEASGINGHGAVVGSFQDPASLQTWPFVYRDGRLRELDPALNGTVAGYAYAINESGQVAGTLNGRAYVHDGTQVRFIPTEGADFAAAWSLNDHGVAVGRADFDPGVESRAFVYDGSTLSYLPAPTASHWIVGGADINNAGQIVVNAASQSFLYSEGRYQNLDTLGAYFVGARALNESGWVVGAYSADFIADPNPRAFLWREGRMQDLNALIDPAARRQWTLLSAADINERGQIAGYGLIGGVTHAYLATPVPEPGTWALMLAGVGLVGAAARRRTGG